MDTNYLELLIELIIGNASLNYSKDELRINNDETIMQILKVIAKDKYENKLEDLQAKENNREAVQCP